MIEKERKRRVLLVGAGRRIQNNFLPALACLQKDFAISGIHSRTEAKLLEVARRWGVPSVPSLAEFDLSEVDVVAISVPTSQNANVLHQLQAAAANLELVIDTPIASDGSEHAAIAPLLKSFKNVIVAEDYMNFPRFALIRSVVEKGKIGPLRSLTLYNIGFQYHGLALIRSFVGFDPVVQSWRKPLSSRASVIGYAFDGDVSATVVGPYRRHSTGGIFVEGHTGFISEFPIDKESAPPDKKAFVLSKLTTDGLLSGFEIRGESEAFSVDLDDMRRMRALDFADKSDLNLERGCGLINVFRSLLDFRNFNRNYGAADAFYDCFVSRRAESGESPLDPFNTFAGRPSAGHPRAFWVARSATFVKKSAEMAAELDSDQKLEVASGARIEAETATAAQGHIVLTHVKLNGKPLSGAPWFIHPTAWEPAEGAAAT
jgi:Oxidoreductase family, NAD-binding Rossmann fold